MPVRKGCNSQYSIGLVKISCDGIFLRCTLPGAAAGVFTYLGRYKALYYHCLELVLQR